MAAQQGKEGGGSMDGAAWAILALLLLGLCYLFWIMKRELIVIPMFTLDYYEYLGLSKIHLLDRVGFEAMNFCHMVITNQYPAKQVSFELFQRVINDISNRTYIFWIVLTCILTLIVIFKMKGEGFKRNFTLTGRAKGNVVRFCGMVINNDFLKALLTADFKIKFIAAIWNFILKITFIKKFVTKKKEWKDNGSSFIHYQAESWPVSIMSATFEPDLNEPNEISQRRPLDWMKDHNIGVHDGKVDEETAAMVFANQLGETWTNIESASIHVQAIMILSALNLLNSNNDFPQYGGKVAKLRDELALIYGHHFDKHKEMVAAALAPYLKDKRIINAINKRASRHAYVNTACVAIYGWGGPNGDNGWGGGKAGILSSSQFRWVKKVDRTLWYGLNNVGRRKFHIEGAGIINHFFAENVLRAPRTSPAVTEACSGLKDYVAERGINNIEDFYAQRDHKDFE